VIAWCLEIRWRYRTDGWQEKKNDGGKCGFYGVIIDMTDDTVIVEFGSNKNCRIPMQKVAIVQVEKPETK